MGGAIIGYVDENNVIVLVGGLEGETYTVKYQMEDESLIDIGELVLFEPEEVINQIPISTDASGNLFVGTNGEAGYKTGYRLSTSIGNEIEHAGTEVTGYIPVKYGDTLYIRGITISASATTEAIVWYDASYARLGGSYAGTFFGDVTGEVKSNVLNSTTLPSGTFTEDVAYIRVAAGEINASSVITVNQEIGELDLVVKHSVTNNLTNCTNSNDSTEVVTGDSYTATITAGEGYILSSSHSNNGRRGYNLICCQVSGNNGISSATGDIIVEALQRWQIEHNKLFSLCWRRWLSQSRDAQVRECKTERML